jgi:hypothetical protein
MRINEWVKRAFLLAKEKGWHDEGKTKTPVECHMLMVTEIAEATESFRKSEPPVFAVDNDGYHCTNMATIVEKNWKPEGEAVELADVVIRIFDYFGSKDWDLEAVIAMKHKYNASRPYRHGGKVV